MSTNVEFDIVQLADDLLKSVHVQDARVFSDTCSVDAVVRKGRLLFEFSDDRFFFGRLKKADDASRIEFIRDDPLGVMFALYMGPKQTADLLVAHASTNDPLRTDTSDALRVLVHSAPGFAEEFFRTEIITLSALLCDVCASTAIGSGRFSSLFLFCQNEFIDEKGWKQTEASRVNLIYYSFWSNRVNAGSSAPYAARWLFREYTKDEGEPGSEGRLCHTLLSKIPSDAVTWAALFFSSPTNCLSFLSTHTSEIQAIYDACVSAKKGEGTEEEYRALRTRAYRDMVALSRALQTGSEPLRWTTTLY